MAHQLYPLVAERAGRRCEYCLAPEAIFNSPFEVEHITPEDLGGPDEEWNLALACRSCNASKWKATDAPDPSSGQVVRLFNPRTDEWDEHFTLNLTTAEIVGRTAIGRATMARLKMNGPKQREARRLWILLFAFPDEPPDSVGDHE
jgi:hypothetical protein